MTEPNILWYTHFEKPLSFESENETNIAGIGAPPNFHVFKTHVPKAEFHYSPTSYFWQPLWITVKYPSQSVRKSDLIWMHIIASIVHSQT